MKSARSFASLHAATKIDFQTHEPARNASFSVWQLAGEEGARETTPCATALLFHMRALSDLTKLLELAIAVPYVIILVAERDNNHTIPASILSACDAMATTGLNAVRMNACDIAALLWRSGGWWCFR